MRNEACPRGLTAVGVLLIFGACMASLAGTTLIWSGTSLGRVWALNPRAYRELAPYGKAAGIPFLLLAISLAVASLGWFKRRLWGWLLAVIIIGTQVLGNLVNIFVGRIVEGALGIAIAGAVLYYLLRASVRTAFRRKPRAGDEILKLVPKVDD